MLYRRNCSPLLYFDWLFRFWIYFDSPAHLISWYAAAGFFFGGALFIIGSFSSVAPAVRHWPASNQLDASSLCLHACNIIKAPDMW